MKALFFVFCCLAVTKSYATANIGDRVVYKVKNTYQSISINALFEKKIIGFKDGKYLISQTITSQDGRANSEQVEVLAQDMYSKTSLSATMEKCSLIGKIVQMKYPAGKMETCKFTRTEGENSVLVHFAFVPFGLAQMTSKSADSSVEMVIQEFAFGPAQ